jgi:hypothetical protein
MSFKGGFCMDLVRKNKIYVFLRFLTNPRFLIKVSKRDFNKDPLSAAETAEVEEKIRDRLIPAILNLRCERYKARSVWRVFGITFYVNPSL